MNHYPYNPYEDHGPYESNEPYDFYDEEERQFLNLPGSFTGQFPGSGFQGPPSFGPGGSPGGGFQGGGFPGGPGSFSGGTGGFPGGPGGFPGGTGGFPGGPGGFPGGTGGFPGGPGGFPGGTGGFPGGPGGFPGGPGGFPGGPGGPGGQQSGPPTSPPPNFTPQQSQFQTFAVDPGGIRGCLFRNTYIWLNRREQFWYFPTFVGRNSVAGWRWRGNRWVFFGIDLNQIQSFQCF